MRIILDTNIFYPDLSMSGVEFNVFTEGLRRMRANFYLPDVVFYEVMVIAKERASAAIAQIRKAERDIQRLIGGFGEKPQIQESEILAAFEYQFQDSISALGGKRVACPEPLHKDVVERLLSGKKPFGSGRFKERGYRDFLIWLTVVEAAAEDSVIFITNNSKDFTVDEGLHPDLCEDLRTREIPLDQVRIFDSLNTFNSTIVKPLLEELDYIKQQILQDKFGEFRILDWIKANANLLIAGWGDNAWYRYTPWWTPGHISKAIAKRVECIHIENVLAMTSPFVLVTGVAVFQVESYLFPVDDEKEAIRKLANSDRSELKCASIDAASTNIVGPPKGPFNLRIQNYFELILDTQTSVVVDFNDGHSSSVNDQLMRAIAERNIKNTIFPAHENGGGEI